MFGEASYLVPNLHSKARRDDQNMCKDLRRALRVACQVRTWSEVVALMLDIMTRASNYNSPDEEVSGFRMDPQQRPERRYRVRSLGFKEKLLSISTTLDRSDF